MDALSGRADEIIDCARRWVEENSHTYNIPGVNAVARLLERDFALGGLRLKSVESQRFGRHLVWRTPAASRAPPILLIGHHDTVFPPGQFEGWRQDGDRAVGPGALDMKGGWAIVRAVLATLDEADALAALPLVVVSVSDEEVGSPDSAPHLRRIAQGAACALVFESGRAEDAIITQRRGSGALVATAHGVAAHAGNQHREGKNAVWSLAHFVCGVQALSDYERNVTVNVGLIRGGTSRNSVPDQARCELDVRFATQPDAREVLDKIAELAGAAAQAVPGTRIELEGGIHRLPWQRVDASVALCAEYAACQKHAGLGDGEAGLVGGGSDANTVGALGVPTIDGLGPRGAGFHTRDEYIELSSLLPKAEALLRFLWNRRRLS